MRPERRTVVHQLAAIEQREGGVIGPLGHIARELEALGRTLPRGAPQLVAVEERIGGAHDHAFEIAVVLGVGIE